MDRSGYEITYDYDAATNQTKVLWGATINNNTIYKIDEFSVNFSLYSDSTHIGDEEFYYSVEINNGGTYSGKFYFTYDGEITNAEFISWTADYLSFWDTYKIWIIVMIVIASVGALIYILVMIIEDLDLDDTWEALTDFDGVFQIGLWMVPGILVVVGVVASYWVPVLIVLGGIVAFVIIALLAHLIKFIVEVFSDACEPKGSKHDRQDDSDEFDVSYHTIDECVNDRDKLMMFTAADLKDYCCENNIKGYSKLKKSELVDLIMNNVDVTQASDGNNKTSTSKKTSKITFEDIAGLDDVKAAFREKVILPFEHPDIFEKFGKKSGGGILLYGLPGTGKTMFAEAASNEVDALFIPIKCSDIKSKWYGESEQKVKAIFSKARKTKKAIIFFDEFEAIGAKRTDSENGNNDLVPEILAEMQGIGSNRNSSTIIVIAATNKPWSIDSAFLRPGRFDEKIYVPLPDETARKKLVELQLKKLPIEDDFDYEHLVAITDGFNGADIKEVCEKLKMQAIKRSIENNSEEKISNADLRNIEGSIKSSVNIEEIEMLKEFERSF